MLYKCRVFFLVVFIYLCFISIFVRYSVMKKFLNGINDHEGGIDRFTKSYERYGLKRVGNGVMCREWCPAASAVFIMGDFSKYLVLEFYCFFCSN